MISSARYGLLKITALLVLVVLVIPGAGLVFADDSPQALLDRMSHSFRELDYHGTFSFQQGNSTESFRMAHAVIDGEEFERLEYLDGEKREIVRRGHNLNCVHPGHKLLRLYQQQLQLDSAADGGVGDFYQFSVTGSGRVAGREVVNLEISPKDTHRFGYHLSLDKETGLLLRTELVGPGKTILERFQFVEITIGEPIAPEQFVDAGGSHQAKHVEPLAADTVAKSVMGQGWTVKWLPAGFTSAVANLKFVSGDMATFTDGLTVFSVFLERDVDSDVMQRGLEGNAQKGATTAYSRLLVLADHPYRITVVGEIPAQTAQQIAQSVRLVSSP
ncbi:MAG: MucB/RseB C-terminal domain-containing protein [Oceanicoccus sp.]